MASQELPGFHAEEVAIGSAVMVSLHGELDLQYKSEVAAAFDRALDHKPSALAADLRGLTFIDSTGIHALINAERRCHTHGARFILIRGSVAVGQVLSVLGLDLRFQIIASPDHLDGDSSSVLAAAV